MTECLWTWRQSIPVTVEFDIEGSFGDRNGHRLDQPTSKLESYFTTQDVLLYKLDNGISGHVRIVKLVNKVQRGRCFDQT
jgi:hypothetical protein